MIDRPAALPEMRIVAMQADSPICWALWPLLEERLYRIMPTLTPETPPEMLVRQLRVAFASGAPTYHIQCLLGSDNTIYGHTIAWVEQSWGKSYGFVHQISSDVPAKQYHPDSVRLLRSWVNGLNANNVVTPQIEALRWMADKGRDGAWHRVFGRLTEFSRSVMTMPLEKLHEDNFV